MGKYLEMVNKNGYEYVTRKIGKDGAVVIIPSNSKGEYQLILSNRPTFEKPIIEFPAGLIDHEGETIVDVAARELNEETGWCWDNPQDVDIYSPFWMKECKPSPSSAGLSDEVIYIVFANIDKAVQKSTIFDGNERITVLPLMTIPQLYYYSMTNDVLVSSRVMTYIMGNMKK